jgi:PTH1 family peptidyl-tRNA hydrolase
MNQSGFPVKNLLQQENLGVDRLLVVVDDFMIPFGSLRLRPAGSSGGHNGLKSLIEVLATEAFPRLRVGVGPVPGGLDPADFVLDRFTADEQKGLPTLYKVMREGIEVFLNEGEQKAMSFLNKEHF